MVDGYDGHFVGREGSHPGHSFQRQWQKCCFHFVVIAQPKLLLMCLYCVGCCWWVWVVVRRHYQYQYKSALSDLVLANTLTDLFLVSGGQQPAHCPAQHHSNGSLITLQYLTPHHCQQPTNRNVWPLRTRHNALMDWTLQLKQSCLF